MSTIETPSVADKAMDILRSRILVDGFKIVMNLRKSHDCYLYDELSGDEFLDFYGFFASQPIGYNHPKLVADDFRDAVMPAATTKVANADVYTVEYAEFVRAFAEIAAPANFQHFFFVDGGGLAVENALKAAFDWKVRKNMAAGHGEVGGQVIHFRRGFHGRTGYTLSLTDTADPRKTMYFPKFPWPRIDNPAINFALDEPERTTDVAARETASINAIEQAIQQHSPDIAAILIEPIQGEGGDNHFRGEFLHALRRIADQNDILLVFDEVQTGLGVTGKMWAHQHFDVEPDIIAFGKKVQTCGIMAGPRIDEVEENVFRVASRINSTWGGNLADMVRCTRFLEVIRDENLVGNAACQGVRLLDGLHALASRHAQMSAVRGRGLFCAFDLPDGETRDNTLRACLDRRMMVLPCGDRSLRFRPVLDVQPEHIDRGLEILDSALGSTS